VKEVMFVSFYTENYSKHAETLVASLEKFGVRYDVQEVSRANWRHAVCSKPAFIRDMMNKHRNVDAIVWLDADSYLAKRPNVFWQLECDVSAPFIYWQRKLKVELVLNTLYLKQSERVREMVDKWADLMAEVTPDMRCPEQEVLMKLMPKYKDLVVYDLPPSYSHMLSEKFKRATIVQFQQSRYEREPEKRVLIEDKVKLHNWQWVKEATRNKQAARDFKELQRKVLKEINEPDERIILLNAARETFTGVEFIQQINKMIKEQVANGHAIKRDDLHPKKAQKQLRKATKKRKNGDKPTSRRRGR